MAFTLSKVFSGWSPFSDDTKRVEASDIRAVAQPVHSNQRVEKTYTITSNGNANTAVSEINVCAPGLTIVRVRPELLEEAGPDVLAKVRVSSDAAEHIDRVEVDTTAQGDLTVSYSPRKGTVGHLVTEIDIAQPSQVGSCMAFTRGDVVITENVLGMPMEKNAGPSLLAAMGSRLFIASPTKEPRFYDLGSIRAGSSSIFVKTPKLWLKDHLVVMIGGRGRAQIEADSLSSGTMCLMNFGESRTLLTASSRFHMAGMFGLQRSAGSIQVRSPLMAACAGVVLEARHRGHIDVADISSENALVRFKAPHGGSVIMAVPSDEVEYICKPGVSGLVQYTSTPPPAVCRKEAETPGFRLENLSADDVRSLREGTLDLVPVPTLASAFETPMELEKPKEGLILPAKTSVLRSFLPFEPLVLRLGEQNGHTISSVTSHGWRRSPNQEFTNQHRCQLDCRRQRNVITRVEF